MPKCTVANIYDSKSYGVSHYVGELTAALNKHSVFNAVKISRLFIYNRYHVKVYHYSNSTRSVLIDIVLSPGKKVVVVHDVLPRSKLLQLFAYYGYRLINLRKPLFIVHTKNALSLFCATAPFIDTNRIYVIPHGTTIPTVNLHDRSSARKKFEISKSTTVLLMVGGISRARGQIEFLRSYRDNSPDNAYLLIAGAISDPSVLSMINQISNCKYFGFVSPEILKELYLCADVLVSYRTSSVGESSGPIATGLGYGLPVITSVVTPFADMVGEAGIKYDIKNDSLQAVINSIAANYASLSKAAIVAAQNSSWETVAGKFEVLLV